MDIPKLLGIDTSPKTGYKKPEKYPPRYVNVDLTYERIGNTNRAFVKNTYGSLDYIYGDAI
jgi:hypothetical protein